MRHRTFNPRWVATLACASMLLLLSAGSAGADWPTDPYAGFPITLTEGPEYEVQAVPDGAGGAILTWQAERYLPDLLGIDFVSTSIGMAVGEDGIVLKTTDGGVSWKDMSSGTAARLESIDLLSTSVAVAVGEKGTIIRTTDGGQTWTSPSSGVLASLKDVDFSGTSYGLAVGDAGTMLRTVDGGATWTPVAYSTTNLTGVSFVTTTVVYVVGDGGVVLKSTNGGVSWTSVSPATSYDFYAVDFYNTSYGTAVGQFGIIARTENGGTSWSTTLGTYNYDDLYDVDMITSIHVVATGDETAQTTNGTSWYTVYPVGSYGRSCRFLSATTGVIVGRYGFIVTTTDLAGDVWVQRDRGQDIVAQRLSPDGEKMWGSEGVTVCSAIGDQYSPRMTADGAGGAVILWTDDRTEIWGQLTWAQRIDENGFPLWTTDGVQVADTAYATVEPGGIVADGSGGALFVFDRNNDIYAQRIYANGSTWAPGATPIYTGASIQSQPRIAPDGNGGAMIVWKDNRVGNYNLYAQWIDGNRILRFGSTGYSVASTADTETNPVVTSTGAEGVVIAYDRWPAGIREVVAQLLTWEGQRAWGTDGVVLRSLPETAYVEDVVPDGSGGAIVVWTDSRNSANEVYANRVTGVGNVSWGSSGYQASATNAPLNTPRAVSDGDGGVIIVWEDHRSHCCATQDLYGQHMNEYGSRLWPIEGRPIAVGMESQRACAVVADGEGGAYVAWEDTRYSYLPDVYGAFVDRHGYLGDMSPAITSVVDSPGDQGGKVVVSWDPSFLDDYPNEVVLNYSLWRRTGPAGVSARGASAAGAGESAPDAEAKDRALAAGFEAGFVARQAASGWAFVDETEAFYLESYAYEAPTFGDSTASGLPTTEYQVIAHASNHWIFWVSNPLGGYSVDNLAPSAPVMLSGSRTDGDVALHWLPGTEHYEDLRHYAIYRGETAGFTPGPDNLIGTTADTTHVDTDPGPAAHYYRVTAIDIHDNEGDASNELEIEGEATGTKTPALPTVFTLMPNQPNPFSRMTTIRFGLPSSAEVTIEVYDVAGRRVFADRTTRNAGWQNYLFTGNNLPSGVYFYRLTAAGRTETRKMVITR